MRIARLHIPGVVHHLIWRFVDRDWFFTSDEERSRYLFWLGRALKETDWQCLAYALMSSHIHLAVVAGDTPLATWSRVNAPFASWMNERRGRLGPLFADRAKDFAKSPAAVEECIAYIHNNPVKDGVVAAAEDSTWTSHRAYLGLDPAPWWLQVDEGMQRASLIGRDLRAVVAAAPLELVGVDLRRIGHAARRHGALELATPLTHVVPLVRRRLARVRPDPRRVVALVCEAYEIRIDELCSRRRTRAICEARAVVAHCARRLGVLGSEVAAVLGVSAQAISRIQLCRGCNERVCERIVARLQQETQFPS